MSSTTTFKDLEDGEAFQLANTYEEDTIYIKDTSGSFFTNAYEAENQDLEEYLNPNTGVKRTVQPAER